MLCLKEVIRMMMLLVGAHDDNAFGWQDVVGDRNFVPGAGLTKPAIHSRF